MKSDNLSLYDRLFKPRTYTLEDGKQIQEKRSRLPLVLIILLIATVVSGELTGFSFSTLVKRINYSIIFSTSKCCDKCGKYTFPILVQSPFANSKILNPLLI